MDHARDALVSIEILQLRNILYEKACELVATGEWYWRTPKIIATAAMKQAEYHFLFVACRYSVSI